MYRACKTFAQYLLQPTYLPCFTSERGIQKDRESKRYVKQLMWDLHRKRVERVRDTDIPFLKPSAA